MARQQMLVDVEALQVAIRDAVIPATKAFAILDAVGVSRSDQAVRSKHGTRAPKRPQDEKVRD